MRLTTWIEFTSQFASASDSRAPDERNLNVHIKPYPTTQYSTHLLQTRSFYAMYALILMLFSHLKVNKIMLFLLQKSLSIYYYYYQRSNISMPLNDL